MKYLYSFFTAILFLFPAASFALDFSPTANPQCTLPDVGLYTYFNASAGGHFSCDSPESCSAIAFNKQFGSQSGTKENAGFTSEVTLSYSFGSVQSVSSSNYTVYSYTQTKTPSGSNESPTAVVIPKTFGFTPNKTCGDPPPVVDPDDCSAKSTTDSIVAVFEGPNQFTLTGCFDNCSISTERNDGGQGVTARTNNGDGSFTARGYYTGASCSSESVATEAVDGDVVTVSAPSNGDVLIQVPDLQIAIEFPEVIDAAVDTEQQINTATPVDNITDVVSQVLEDGTPTASTLDNNPKSIDSTVYPDVTEVVVVSENSNGLPVMTSLQVHNNSTGTGDTSTTGTGGSGGGTGTGTGTGNSDIDLSGVESGLQEIKDAIEGIEAGSPSGTLDTEGLSLTGLIQATETENEELKQSISDKFEEIKLAVSGLIVLNGGSGSCPQLSFDIPFKGVVSVSPCSPDYMPVWSMLQGIILFLSGFAAVRIMFFSGGS